MMAVAYIVAPMALKLLRTPGYIPTLQARKTARIAALTVVAVTSTLEIFLPRIATAGLQELNPASLIPVYAIRSLASLIAAIPYILLYIAFYLIANPDSPRIASPEASLDLAGPSQPFLPKRRDLLMAQ
jgi:hypothetical protein